MVTFKWSKEFETGIGAIDRDHKGLFALINDLHDKVQYGSMDTLTVTLDALAAYVDAHFEREEALMEAAGYDGLATHLTTHRRLADKVSAYRKAFERDPRAFDLEDFMAFLADWLGNHIRRADMDYLAAVKAADIDDAKLR